MDQTHCTLVLKSLSDAGEFEGFGSVYGVVDRDNDIIERGAFTESIQKAHSSKVMPSLLWNHNLGEPIGDIISLTERDDVVELKGKLWLGKGVPRSEQAYMMLKGNGVKGLSPGFLCPNSHKKFDPKSGIRRISKGELLEFSITPAPINKSALIHNVKGMDYLTTRQAEDILRDAGFSGNDAKAFIAALKKGMVGRDDSPELADVMAQAKKTLGILQA